MAWVNAGWLESMGTPGSLLGPLLHGVRYQVLFKISLLPMFPPNSAEGFTTALVCPRHFFKRRKLCWHFISFVISDIFVQFIFNLIVLVFRIQLSVKSLSIARRMKLWKHLFFRYLDYIFMSLLVVYERFVHIVAQEWTGNCVARCYCCFYKKPACLRAVSGWFARG